MGCVNLWVVKITFFTDSLDSIVYFDRAGINQITNSNDKKLSIMYWMFRCHFVYLNFESRWSLKEWIDNELKDVYTLCRTCYPDVVADAHFLTVE